MFCGLGDLSALTHFKVCRSHEKFGNKDSDKTILNHTGLQLMNEFFPFLCIEEISKTRPNGEISFFLFLRVQSSKIPPGS